MKIAFYDTSLTDAQWAYLQPLLPKSSRLGRPPIDRRLIVDAILYVVKGGIQWRLMPSDFPSCKTVFHIFRKWCLDGTWEKINGLLRDRVRKSQGKKSRPTAALSVTTKRLSPVPKPSSISP